MAVSICAFNSLELADEELINDGLNLFVKWELSDQFSDLLLRREMVQDLAELDQIAKIVNVNVEPIYATSFYWDKEEEKEHLSRFNSDEDLEKQRMIIQTNNDSLLKNIDSVYETIIQLENELSKVDQLEYLIISSNDGFFHNNEYFSKNNRSFDNLYSDVKKIKEFIEFVKSLDGDTVYFKFKSVYKNQS
ncbi:MAG: hypothetical protein K0S23_321 [Fluviicola sp.]|jgi:hypothetical protein|uniref:hypothetical protein n=1 Tax=Fluviicola sp. TaxID=1917219 RepID=UPI00261CAF93|nr:hypothetical protein [Fluviicola sp.]MDF3026014.1 hypothetical protein [Fluviicola sp.]